MEFRAIAGKLSGVWFYADGLFVHAFLLMSSSRSALFFRMWTKVTKEVRGTAVEYPRLHFKLNLICIIVIVSCVGENILYHVFSMRTGNLMKITGKSSVIHMPATVVLSTCRLQSFPNNYRNHCVCWPCWFLLKLGRSNSGTSCGLLPIK